MKIFSLLRLFICSAFGLCLGTAAPGHAEGGELELRLGTTQNLARLGYPSFTEVPGSALVYVPQFGAALHYGLSHCLELAAGVEMSLPRDVVAYDAELPHMPTGLRVQQAHVYHDLILPLSLWWHPSRGRQISVAVGALSGFWWESWHIVARRTAGPTGQGLSFDRTDAEWSMAPLVGGQIDVRWRPLDLLSLQASPSFRYRIGGDLYAGLQLSLSLLAGVGPSF